MDECVPRKLKHSIVGHQCHTAPEAGFAGKKNGLLLTLAEKAGFQILVTMDQGLQYQQNLDGRRISILVLRAESNRLKHLVPLDDAILLAPVSIQPGEVVRVSR